MAFCIFLSVKTGLDVICRPVPSRKVEVVAIAGGFVLEEVIARVSSIIVREEWCRFLPNLKPNAVVLLGCLPFDRRNRLGCRKHNGKPFTSLP